MKKSEALRKAAEQIKNNKSEFDWYTTEKCNCGILAQVVLDVSAGKLKDTIGQANLSCWSSMSHRVTALEYYSICPTTGLGMVEVFKALYDLGFTRAELEALEMLTDLEYIDNIDAVIDSRNYYTRAHNVIKYMNNWAGKLEDQGL